MNPHPDQHFIEAILTNNTATIRLIYERFAGKICKMVLQNNGSEADAADLFQEALLAIYQRATNRDFVLTCPFEAYLYMICRNRWLNELYKKGVRKVTFTDPEGFNHGEDVFAQAEITRNQYERRNLLLQKMKELGEGCRQLLELSWSGLSMEQVAAKLNNSYGYVRKKKSECMAKLVALVKAAPGFSTLQW